VQPLLPGTVAGQHLIKSCQWGLPFLFGHVFSLFRLTKYIIVEPLNRPIKRVFGFNGSIVEWQKAFKV
jgi:hypothetical protein